MFANIFVQSNFWKLNFIFKIFYPRICDQWCKALDKMKSENVVYNALSYLVTDVIISIILCYLIFFSSDTTWYPIYCMSGILKN